MNIEKLGIKPIRIYDTSEWDIDYICLPADVKELEQQRNDLLKDQIELMLLAKDRIDTDPKWIGTIENVTKMKWEEIKKL